MKDARGTIIAHALRLFMENGYKGMSLNDLTKVTGLSKGAIYHHFRDKDDLFTATIDHFFLQFLPSHGSELPAGVEATVAKLVDDYATMLDAVGQVTPDRLAYFRFILAITPKIRPQMLERMAMVRNHLSATIAAETSTGRVVQDRPAAMLADQILCLIEGSGLLAAIADQPDPADVMRQTVMSFVATLIR